MNFKITDKKHSNNLVDIIMFWEIILYLFDLR